jgi:hypothetical protein
MNLLLMYAYPMAVYQPTSQGQVQALLGSIDYDRVFQRSNKALGPGSWQLQSHQDTRCHMSL